MDNIEMKMIKAKNEILLSHPFFGFLSLYLKIKRSNKKIDDIYTMAVTEKGEMFYDENFVEKLKHEELVGCLCHEILHVALLHITRTNNREPEKWNWAIDLATNSLLIKNGFKLPMGLGLLIPNHNDDWEIPKWLVDYAKKKGKNPQTKIEKISTKTAEEIYDELPDLPVPKVKIVLVGGDGKGGQETKEMDLDEFKGLIEKVRGWDKHIREGKTEADKNQAESDWLNRVSQSHMMAQQVGKVPLGIERYLDEIKKAQIDWKTLLRRHITSFLPHDYTWRKRSKKSIPLGVYLPSTEKERIEVAIGIDTSGSIGKEELTDFVSEIVGMAQAYKDRLCIRVMCHDYTVHTDNEVVNGNIEKIKKIEIKGGGGTSHIDVMNYVRDKVKKAKVFVSLTDGYSDIESIDLKSYPYAKIFVISKKGTTKPLENSKEAVVVKIK